MTSIVPLEQPMGLEISPQTIFRKLLCNHHSVLMIGDNAIGSIHLMTYCELNQSKLADTILLTFVNNAQQDQPAEGVSPNAVENFSVVL